MYNEEKVFIFTTIFEDIALVKNKSELEPIVWSNL
jgi:hypothetical protein